jgi:hypothetical protein
LHGSDFPVPVLGHRIWAQGWVNWATFRAGQNIANPLERDWFFKQALGFTEDTRTRVERLLRIAERLPV